MVEMNKKVLEFEYKDFLNKNLSINVLDVCSLDNLNRLYNNCESNLSRCKDVVMKKKNYEYGLVLLERINMNIIRLGGKGKKVEIKVLDSLEKVEKELNNIRSKISIDLGKGKNDRIEELRLEESRVLEIKRKLKGNSVNDVVKNKIEELRSLIIEGEDNKEVLKMIEILESCNK